jgi:hypothetical protein
MEETAAEPSPVNRVELELEQLSLGRGDLLVFSLSLLFFSSSFFLTFTL